MYSYCKYWKADVPAIINPKECYSIITTGLLENLDIKCNNVKFIREQIILLGKYVNIIGKIKRFDFNLQFNLLHHDVFIVNNETPLLLFGQDWISRYNVQCNSTCTHLYINYLQGKVCVPVY